MAIVGVHGVGNYAPAHPAELVARRRAGNWAAAVATGLGISPDRINLVFAYYAPHLHQGTSAAQGTIAADIDSVLDHLPEESTEFATAWLDALDLPNATAQGRLTIPLRHAVALAANKYSLDGRLTKLFVAVCFPEVAAYLRGPDASARINAREEVANTIARARPRVVIAHSLGTVVAYEALHAHTELEVELLLTLGSPLALPRAVFHRLSPPPQRGVGHRPPNVKRWVNISDHGDPVAILRPLKLYFPGVDLDLAESIGLFDFHRAGRYLSCAATAAAIHPYLGELPVGS